MLKIAEYNTITGEKIDLKELEKYGFVQNKYIEETFYTQEHYKAEEYNDVFNCFNFEIIVNPYDSKCKNEVVGCFNANEDKIDESFNLDILYDLIKDGLVEKVGE